ncbi:MAG: TatD family hydrolase [Tissierellia bacterium]|nr:TatD family hydrolase [Tissierellia bacterium]
MIDSHVHLDDRRFKRDRDFLIRSLEKNGVDYVVNIGVDLRSSKDSVLLSKKYDNVYATIGVHPHEAKNYTQEVEDGLRHLAKEEKVVAFGEIGLDFYYDNSPRDIQIEVFETQLELAEELGLPIVIHSREAAKPTFDRIKAHIEKYPNSKFLIHCYSGSVEMMKDYTDLGCYIALGGVVTFQNAKVPKEVAKQVPLDKLILETDSPYLTPDPFRGRRNEPMYVKFVAEKIAKIKGISVGELVEHTDKNTNTFYGIKG